MYFSSLASTDSEQTIIFLPKCVRGCHYSPWFFNFRSLQLLLDFMFFSCEHGKFWFYTYELLAKSFLTLLLHCKSDWLDNGFPYIVKVLMFMVLWEISFFNSKLINSVMSFVRPMYFKPFSPSPKCILLSLLYWYIHTYIHIYSPVVFKKKTAFFIGRIWWWLEFFSVFIKGVFNQSIYS